MLLPQEQRILCSRNYILNLTLELVIGEKGSRIQKFSDLQNASTWLLENTFIVDKSRFSSEGQNFHILNFFIP